MRISNLRELLLSKAKYSQDEKNYGHKAYDVNDASHLLSVLSHSVSAFSVAGVFVLPKTDTNIDQCPCFFSQFLALRCRKTAVVVGYGISI
jgi:hypothetical protein